MTKRSEHGAALLLAMVILTLVATLAAGMVWQQSRAVQLEGALRVGTQADWVLDGALSWAKMLLREDSRRPGVDDLSEPWATPLARTRLSSFLAVDRENNADSGPDAFLSGAIEDAQSRYNLRNLVDPDGKVSPVELRGLEQLCQAAGAPADVAALIAGGLRAAWFGDEAAPDTAPLAPGRVRQLVWLGLDAATVERLEPFLTLLPARTPVNVNTAGRQALLAAIDGLDAGTAERIVQARQQRVRFDKLDDLQALLPSGVKADEKRVAFRSNYFYVDGLLELDARAVHQRTLVQRGGTGSDVTAIDRERLPAAGTAQRQ